MLFKNIKNINYKKFLLPIITLILLFGLALFIIGSINTASETSKDVFAYIVKVRDSVEEVDRIFESAETNVNVLADSISNSYDSSKQQDEKYNFQYIKSIDGLVKSVSGHSPGIDGSWFQLNADLPFSVHAYNWYQFKDDQFINVKDQFGGTPSMDRKITPDDDPYYFDAVSNQKPTWSDVYVDPDTKEAMMTISAPIYKDGKLVGVVGIDISMDTLQQVLKNTQVILYNSDLFLLDKQNKVIISQLIDNSNPTEANYKFLDLFKGKVNESVEYYDKFTKKAAVLMILSNKCKLVITFTDKILFTSLNTIFRIIYGLLILLFISIVVALINYNKISRLTETNKIPPDPSKENDSTQNKS